MAAVKKVGQKNGEVGLLVEYLFCVYTTRATLLTIVYFAWSPRVPMKKLCVRNTWKPAYFFLSSLSLYLSLYVTFRRARARSCHVFEIRQPQQSVAHHSHQDCGKKELGTTEQSLFEHFGIPK